MNDWVDPNCFFTVGKGMMNGKIIYKDLFEQKGPLLYFIHGIAYLISHKTFLGVYILEVISFSIFLFFSYKLINLFLEIKYSYVILPFLACLVLASKSFSAGDSAEEFGLALITISLYFLIKYFSSQYPAFIGYKVILINGIIAGCILWIKYTMLGFWFSWMMFMFIALVINKQYIKAVKSCFIFLLGMIITSIPWVIYFAINEALFDWINAYFITNIFLYSIKMNIVERVFSLCKFMLAMMITQYVFSFFFIIGICYFIFTKKYFKEIISKLALISCGLFLIFGVYGGGRTYIYYFLIFYPFSILGFIVIADIYKRFLSNNILKIIVLQLKQIKLIPIVVCLSVILSYFLSDNVYFMKYKRDDLVQYKFSKIINQTPNTTLLNYGFLDGGFYTISDILPNTKYFCKLNIPYTKFHEMMDEQNMLIQQKKVEYIVVSLSSSQSIFNVDIPYLLDNYECISVEAQYLGSNDSYYLFKSK